MRVLTVELTVDNKRLCFAMIIVLMIYNYFCCET